MHHVVFGRGVFTSLRRCCEQYLNKKKGALGWNFDGRMQMLGHTKDRAKAYHWFVAIGCCAHDVHRAFHWVMHSHFENEALMKDGHIAVE